MSRIILTRYPTGQERVVCGWDHPCGGAFLQEFNQEPDDGVYTDDWEEVIRDIGFFPGIPLVQFHQSVPEDLRPLITDEVMELLYDHSVDLESGRVIIDLSPTLQVSIPPTWQMSQSRCCGASLRVISSDEGPSLVCSQCGTPFSPS